MLPTDPVNSYPDIVDPLRLDHVTEVLPGFEDFNGEASGLEKFLAAVHNHQVETTGEGEKVEIPTSLTPKELAHQQLITSQLNCVSKTLQYLVKVHPDLAHDMDILARDLVRDVSSAMESMAEGSTYNVPLSEVALARVVNENLKTKDDTSVESITVPAELFLRMKVVNALLADLASYLVCKNITSVNEASLFGLLLLNNFLASTGKAYLENKNINSADLAGLTSYSKA